MRCDIVATLVIDYRQGRTQNAEVHHPPPRGNLPRQGDLRANMRCSQCGFDNPEGMKFCGQCTAALALVCPNCRFENPPGFKFCGQCTTPLVPGAPVPHLSKSSISIRERDSAETLDGDRAVCRYQGLDGAHGGPGSRRGPRDCGSRPQADDRSGQPL